MSLLKRLNALDLVVREPKMKVFNKIYKLKNIESKQVGKCICKGNYCSIDHARFRWTNSKADEILHQLSSVANTDDSENTRHSDKESNNDKNSKTIR